MTTFYITKYALSGGIFAIESEATTSSYHKNGEFSVKDTRPGAYGYNTFNQREAFEDFDTAVADAEKRRATKLQSLRKQIAKLEKLSFAMPTGGAA